METIILKVSKGTVIIQPDFISELCKAVRVRETEASAREIADLACAAVIDLSRQGVKAVNPEEALTKQAVKLYVKANYGYDDDSEKFRASYEALSAAMSLSGDYQEDEDE